MATKTILQEILLTPAYLRELAVKGWALYIHETVAPAEIVAIKKRKVPDQFNGDNVPFTLHPDIQEVLK